jgi:hypothetical protein
MRFQWEGSPEDATLKSLVDLPSGRVHAVMRAQHPHLSRAQVEGRLYSLKQHAATARPPEPPPLPPRTPSASERIAERLRAPERLPPSKPGAPEQTLEPVLIVPDLHAPYHSKPGWDLLLQVARAIKPQHLVIIGDFADFYGVSDHDKHPARANRMDEELDTVNAMLDELDALGASDKLYIEGNHEDRLRRYLMRHPALHNVVTTDRLLRLRERGWEFVPYKRHAARGAVHFTHDVGASGRNAVFRALDTYQHSVVTGHTHRLQYIVEGSAVGDCKVSAMFGWLGDVESVEYMTLAKARKDWALGLGVGYLDPASGFVYLVPVPIVHGSCMVNGQLYRAAA